MIKRSATLKVTTIRRLRVKKIEPAKRTRCHACEREVEIVTRREAAEILGVTDRTLDDFLADARLHVMYTLNGNLWICTDSLFAR